MHSPDKSTGGKLGKKAKLMGETNSQQMTELLKRKKMLIYRANHRGIKEMDIILGQYAKQNVMNFDEIQLDKFEIICNENDRDLLQWIVDEIPVPQHLDNELFQHILNYARQSINWDAN